MMYYDKDTTSLINCLKHSNTFFDLQVAIDTATPLDDAGAGAGASAGAGAGGNFLLPSAESFGGYGGPMRTYGRMYGSLDFDDVSTFICIMLYVDS